MNSATLNAPTTDCAHITVSGLISKLLSYPMDSVVVMGQPKPEVDIELIETSGPRMVVIHLPLAKADGDWA